MSSNKFLKGAAILTMAGLMVKVIGSFNRILLSRLLGGEGIGLYQMAYPVYLLILAVSSAGIPIAISIIVAEKMAKNDYYNAQRVFKISLSLMAATGFVFAAALFFSASALVDSDIISDPRAYYGLAALTPAVFFSTILACFRGYFQGHQLMTPPAVSQILEQLVRVMTMVILAYLLLPYGLEYAAAGAAFGAVPGGITGLLVLSFFYIKYKKQWVKSARQSSISKDSVGSVVKRLVILALPVSCANIMVPVSSSIDMLLVPNMLIGCGYAVDEATALFGYLAGMAQPLLMMATIPTMSLASSLVPAISEAKILNDEAGIRQKADMAVKLCSMLTLPAAVGMSVLAEPISLLLYGTGMAAGVIMHLGPAIWLLGMHQVTTGLLQGIGSINIPMLNMLAGIGAKLAAIYFLTNEAYNILGAAWATNINFAVAAGLNIFVLRQFGLTLPYGYLLRIALAAAGMGIIVYLLHPVLTAGLHIKFAATGMTIILGGIIYFILLLACGGVAKGELKQLPLIRKILK